MLSDERFNNHTIGVDFSQNHPDLLVMRSRQQIDLKQARQYRSPTISDTHSYRSMIDKIQTDDRIGFCSPVPAQRTDWPRCDPLSSTLPLTAVVVLLVLVRITRTTYYQYVGSRTVEVAIEIVLHSSRCGYHALLGGGA